MRYSLLLVAPIVAWVMSIGCKSSRDSASDRSDRSGEPAAPRVAVAGRPGFAGSPAGPVRVDPPAAPGAMAPAVIAGPGEVLATWLEPTAAGAHRVRFARFDGARWSAPVTVAGGPDVVANWADFPALVAGPGGALIAHWAEKSGEDAYAYDVELARSADGGATWIRLGQPHADGTRTEHGFVSLVPEGGAVRAFWLDGRATAGGHGHGGEAMTLRTALVGETVAADREIDARVCDCCGTAAAMTAEGPIVVYRDRGDTEIRDIAIARRAGTAGDAAGHATGHAGAAMTGWTRPRPVHADGWRIAGCPVNGPAVVADGRRVAVAWYTYADATPRIRLAWSDDAGASFSPPTEVDGPRGRSAPIGRVHAVLDGDEALVAWMASERETAHVLIRRVSRDGHLGEPVAIATTHAGRAAGFPRMARLGRDVVIAWTEPGEPSHVRAARLSAASVPPVAATRDDVSPAPPAQVQAQAQAQAALEPGDRAPAYSARTLDGEPISLADLRGHPVLLDVWATWCEPCRVELPELAELHRRHAGDGLRVIGVNVDDDRTGEQVRRFVTRRETPHAIWLDPDDRVSTTLGVTTLPASFLFDRDGTLVWRASGAITADDPELAAALAAALKPR